MKIFRSLCYIFCILIGMNSVNWACNSFKIHKIDFKIKQLKETLAERNYNYNFLNQIKSDLLVDKQYTEKCLQESIKESHRINHVFSTHISSTLTSIEQNDYQRIQSANNENLNLTEQIINEIDVMLVIVNDRLNYAKDYTDYRNQMKTIIDLINIQHFETPTIKPIREFLITKNYGIFQHPYLHTAHISILFVFSLSILKLLRKNNNQQTDPIKKSFYPNTKYSILFFLPLLGIFIFFQLFTYNWLVSPSFMVLVRWLLGMLIIKISAIYYLCYLSKISDPLTHQQALSRICKITNTLYFIGIFQYISLHCFNNNEIIELFFLLITVPIFYVTFMYQSIHFILLITESKPYIKTNAISLKFYRYIAIFLVVFYTTMRLIMGCFGYLMFSSYQLILSIILITYFLKYINIVQHLNDYLTPVNKKLFSHIKSIFVVNPQDKIIELHILISIFNFYLGYLLIILILNILSVSEYQIYMFKNLLSYPIQFNTLDFSIINLTKSLLAFQITVLIGKFFANKITKDPSYSHDLDKKLTISLILHYSIYLIALIIALLFLGLSSGHISFIIGSLGVGMGLGAQYIIHNMLSGLIIMTKKVIHVGDFISLNKNNAIGNFASGKIEKLSILSTQILNEDQLLINVPNSAIIENCVVNYTTSEQVNSCYIHLKIKRIEDYYALVHDILNILKEFPDVVQTHPYHPTIKLLQSTTEKYKSYSDINIDFSITNLNQKQFIYSQIKNRILDTLKNQLYDETSN